MEQELLNTLLSLSLIARQAGRPVEKCLRESACTLYISIFVHLLFRIASMVLISTYYVLLSSPCQAKYQVLLVLADLMVPNELGNSKYLSSLHSISELLVVYGKNLTVQEHRKHEKHHMIMHVRESTYGSLSKHCLHSETIWPKILIMHVEENINQNS